MTSSSQLRTEDLDVDLQMPKGLERLHEQNLLNLTPWHIMPRELALKRMRSLRQRYARKYVPFARRQDNDELACFDPSVPDRVVVIHDFASETTEVRRQFPGFWEWFRTAIEDMITLE
jgi:hypothetical protein